MMITMSEHHPSIRGRYQQLLEDFYSPSGLSGEDSVDLCQHLIDLDLVNFYPGFDQLSDYYVTEGLCYDVVLWIDE